MDVKKVEDFHRSALETDPHIEKLFAELKTLLDMEAKSVMSQKPSNEISGDKQRNILSQKELVADDVTRISVLHMNSPQPVRARLAQMLREPWPVFSLYLLAITLAEALTTALRQPVLGLFLHGLLMVVLVTHASAWAEGKLRRGLSFLALVPLIRLMSLAMPLSGFPKIYWYAIIGAPLLLAAGLAARQSEMGIHEIGLVLRKPGWQILVGLGGVGLGYAEYQILRPEALVSAPTPEQIFLPALILTFFTGVLEEVLFRGMLQPAIGALLGKWSGLIYTAVIFAVMHLGYLSALDIAFVLAVGLAFGWVAQRTGSLIGVIIAHSLTNIGLFLIFPFWR